MRPKGVEGTQAAQNRFYKSCFGSKGVKGTIANCIAMARFVCCNRFTHPALSAENRILHSAQQKWPIQCEEGGAMESDSLDVQLEHCKRCNKVICEECFAMNCSAGPELRGPPLHPTNPNSFTWVHRNYFLKSELPTLFAQQRNLFTPTRFIEDDSDSWSSGMSAEDGSRSGPSAEDDSRSGMSAEDGSQADADTQELRTEVILGTESHDRWTVSADVQGGSAAELDCEFCETTFNGHEDAGN